MKKIYLTCLVVILTSCCYSQTKLSTDVINEYAYIIKEGFIPRLDYLSVVEKVYLKEGENEISK